MELIIADVEEGVICGDYGMIRVVIMGCIQILRGVTKIGSERIQAVRIRRGHISLTKKGQREGWGQAKRTLGHKKRAKRSKKEERTKKKGELIPNPLPRQVVSLRIRLAGTKSYLTVYLKRQESCEAPCRNFDDLSNSFGKFSHA